MCITIKIIFLIVLRQSSFESPHVAMINYFTNYIDLLQHLKNHNILNLLTFQAPLNNSFSFITMDPFLKKKKKLPKLLYINVYFIYYISTSTPQVIDPSSTYISEKHLQLLFINTSLTLFSFSCFLLLGNQTT